MDGFEKKMKAYKEVGENIYPSADILCDIKLLEKNRIRTKAGKRITYFNSLVAALILVLLPVCGYAAYKYPAIFTQLFTEENAYMMDEMIKEENQMVENKDYRLTMEQMLVDGNTRNLLVSVQAKNKESWRTLCEEEYTLGLSTYFAGDIISWEQEDMTSEEEWKKYWTFELTARATITMDMYFLPIADSEEASDIHYDILEGNIELREDYLGMEVKVQGIDVENTTVKMTPDKLKLCEEVQIETVYIDRLGIDMVGNCEKDVLWDTEKEIRPTLYEIRKSVGVVDPEVIVEMKDGTRICLLLDESKELSMEVDKEMEITLLSHNNGLIYHEGVWSNTIVTGLEYKFTEVLDTEQIVKVWIEGVEQDFSK